MKLNSIDNIMNEGGDYIVLVDYGSDGFGIWGQYLTLEAAIKSAMSGAALSDTAILKLVEMPDE